MDMTRCLFCGLCVDACPVDALGMTREFEWAVYDKRQLHLNKQQLLAIGDRSFPVREKRLELQHPNVAFFNVTFTHLPQRRTRPPASSSVLAPHRDDRGGTGCHRAGRKGNRGRTFI